jgi:hypothetical protein
MRETDGEVRRSGKGARGGGACVYRPHGTPWSDNEGDGYRGYESDEDEARAFRNSLFKQGNISVAGCER